MVNVSASSDKQGGSDNADQAPMEVDPVAEEAEVADVKSDEDKLNDAEAPAEDEQPEQAEPQEEEAEEEPAEEPEVVEEADAEPEEELLHHSICPHLT